MTYAETLEYIFQKLPMFSRMGSAAYKKDLVNIKALCQHLGNPHEGLKYIHVAGTNGKGSVSHMLAAVFQQCGYKTGLYTSPHLYDFRERIRLNGAMIPEAYVVAFVESMKPVIESIEPSFFEITVAMAFHYFAEQNVDVAVIEVGLGGRLDSTNIITPALSIITNIGWDHMNLLGDSLPAIAAEKAGIIKAGIPAVVGELLPETAPVFTAVANEKGSRLYLAPECFQVKETTLLSTGIKVDFLTPAGEEFTAETDLPGLYQVENLRTVLTATDTLIKKGWDIPVDTIFTALKQVKKTTGLHGRWDVIQERPLLILEVAHNENGIIKMLEHLGRLSYQKLHLVIGMVKDKEVEKILDLLPADAVYYFTQAQIPRALSAYELKEKAAAFALTGNFFTDVNAALEEAVKKAAPDDLVLVCGSIFLVAEVDRAQYCT